MVDLVKIRKKAKKAAEEAEPTPPAPPPPPASEIREPPAPASEIRDPSEIPESSEIRDPSPPAPSEVRDPSPPGTPPPAESPPAASAPNKLDAFKEQAGRRREGFVTQAADATAGGTRIIELLTFIIGREQYAADIERIVEIVPPRAVTRVPNADAIILGIMSLRGTIVTIVDVRAKLRQEALSAPEDRRVIVVDQYGDLVGFEVDRVMRVIKIDAATVAPSPVVDSSEVDDSIRGVFRHAGALTIQLDFDKLLSDGFQAPDTASGHRSNHATQSGGRNG